MRFLALCLAFAVVFASGAHAQRTIGFAAAPGEGDALVASVAGAEGFGPVRAVLGEEAGAALERAAAAAGFKGGAGETASIYTGAERFGEVHLVGVGVETLRARDYEDFGGRAAGLAKRSKAERVSVLAPAGDGAAAAQVAFGAALGQYDFLLYKSGRSEREGALIVVAPQADAARTAWESERSHVADAVKWTRDVITEPANIVYPEEFVARARAAFRGVSGVTITVLDENQMRRMGMGAIVGVGMGSARPPRMLMIEYRGAGDAAPYLFVGKGITFDTGGISIKPNAGMWRMKYDMSGAAIATGAVLGLAKSRAPVNAVAVAALAENMPSGTAQRPGDVVTTMSGKTVEIMSTDAEGRLVLADGVWYAQERYPNARLLVDVATLTGAAARALGADYGALFTHDDAVSESLLAAGETAGEDLWRMPLHPNYDRQIRSDIADIKNGDTGDPGAGTGAAFIGAFIKDETPWAHIDIAGVAWRNSSTPTMPKGAAGYGVRLLDRLARDGALAQ